MQLLRGVHKTSPLGKLSQFWHAELSVSATLLAWSSLLPSDAQFSIANFRKPRLKIPEHKKEWWGVHSSPLLKPQTGLTWGFQEKGEDSRWFLASVSVSIKQHLPAACNKPGHCSQDRAEEHEDPSPVATAATHCVTACHSVKTTELPETTERQNQNILNYWGDPSAGNDKTPQNSPPK